MSQEGHTRELVEVVTKLVTLQATTGNALQPCELQPVGFAMNFRSAWRDSNSQCPPSRVRGSGLFGPNVAPLGGADEMLDYLKG
jgi:hypothetical protein